MTDVSSAQIEQAVTDIVNDAHKDGSIDELTPRMIRSRAEERLGLEGGTLDAWKEVVKRAATVAIDALEDAASSATASLEEDVKPSKSTSKPRMKAAPSSAKRKSTKKDDEGTPPSKKPRTSSAAKKASAKAKKEEVGKRNGKVVRSASVIPSSDDDGEDDESPKPVSTSKSPGKDSKSPVSTKGKERANAKRPPLPKNTSAHDADVSTAEVGDLSTAEVGDGEAEASAHTKPISKGKSKLQNSVTAQDEGAESVTADDESVGAEEGGGEEGAGDGGKEAKEGADGAGEGAGEKSESEMSVLIDEEPKKRRGKKGEPKTKGKTSKPKEGKASKGKAKKETDEDPEDAEIKRLKSFITACGVRKLWSREFSSAGIPSIPPSTSSNPSQIREIKLAQIRHLKGMLKELGMEGRLSMEKARRVRERRELARELEDVQTFEKAVVHGTSSARSSRQQKDKPSGGNESDVEDALDDRKKGGEGDSEEEVVGKAKRKVNARQSIMAFLGDQSDSE